MPGEIWSRGPELFVGYTDAAATAGRVQCRRLVHDRRHRRARRRRLPRDHRPQEGHHHPRRRERERAGGRGDPRAHARRRRGRGRRRARRAAGRGRVRVLPHAARVHARPILPRCAATSTARASPARSGRSTCVSSTSSRGRRAARCRSSCCANSLRDKRRTRDVTGHLQRIAHGMRVLDAGIWRPVPHATQMLADLGARGVEDRAAGRRSDAQRSRSCSATSRATSAASS